MNIKEADKKYFGRSSQDYTFELKEAKGNLLFDGEGKQYIDFLMGWCVGNIGWENKEVEAEIERFKGPEYVHPQLYYKPWIELAQLLAEITPGNLQVSYRTTGGTESVEAALQIAMLYTGRSKFLSFEGSYHGNSIAAISIGASDSRKKFSNVLSGCLKLEMPLSERTLNKAEKILQKKDVAALIMEPIACNLGVEVPQKIFITELRKLCKKFGTLFIADEVATGFGRTGKLFACNHFDLEPDILCLAKAVSGGYGGLGVTITTEKIAKKANKNLNIYSTYGWHPISVHSTLANIRYILKNEEALLSHVITMENLFNERLVKMNFNGAARIRVKGLAIGVEVKNASYSKTIRKKCIEKGLYIGSEDTQLFMFPAINITAEIAEKGLDLFEQCL
jgi:acetylornithine/succinyldiaminopimelate/putrescine aminotransferase